MRESTATLLSLYTEEETASLTSLIIWFKVDPTRCIEPIKQGLKMKMSEEEQIERIKKNQERLTNRKKPPIPTPCQSSETREEAPFPLRVTRVVTAVLPSSLMARRVSVEDPPPELDNPLPEQIPPEMQQRLAEQSKKLLNKTPRHLVLEGLDQKWPSAEMHQDQPIKKTNRQQRHQGILRSSKKESRADASRAEPKETSRNQVGDLQASVGNEYASLDNRPSALLIPDMDPDYCLTPEQRKAKLCRVERIRERVIRSAVRQNATAHDQLPIRGKGLEVPQVPPDTARKQRMKSDRQSYDGYRSCDHIRGSSELYLSSGTSQDEDERDRHMKKSKSQVKFGNKPQHKVHSGRTGVAKTNIKRPASPYHISSMSVYQKDGDKEFTSCKDGEEQKLEEPAADDNESDFPSSDLRTKWFLSTNQWQGFIPLQIPGIDSLCIEEISDIENQPASSDDLNDFNEISSAVSESLEKTKKNHSLFYKIACDISISDTDITKNDGDPSVQTSSTPEEDKELLITESVPDKVTYNVGRSYNQESKDSSFHLSSAVNENSLSVIDELQDSTQDNAALNTSASPAKEAGVNEEIPQKECEDTSRQDRQLDVIEAVYEASVQNTASDQALDEHTKMREEQSGEKESHNRKVDHEIGDKPKKRRSLSEDNKETIQEGGTNHSITPSSSVYEGGSVIRSASFRKARVTVLRTSL
ncbi:hypothetical protein FQN60_003228 [Etheostoma spectabile]|uniref:Uncharacterized protein n=1 Tax=Etheostoma spectabile TaxID=54343 RepID=A0A5J5CJ26_9PERO|nr:hypothetical protein FQN60_003228 [Etheostoma spectabile]